MDQRIHDVLKEFPGEEAPFQARMFAEPITNLALAVAQQLDSDNGAALALTVAGLQALHAALTYFVEAKELLMMDMPSVPALVDHIEAKVEEREEEFI